MDQAPLLPAAVPMRPAPGPWNQAELKLPISWAKLSLLAVGGGWALTPQLSHAAGLAGRLCGSLQRDKRKLKNVCGEQGGGVGLPAEAGGGSLGLKKCSQSPR